MSRPPQAERPIRRGTLNPYFDEEYKRLRKLRSTGLEPDIAGSVIYPGIGEKGQNPEDSRHMEWPLLRFIRKSYANQRGQEYQDLLREQQRAIEEYENNQENNRVSQLSFPRWLGEKCFGRRCFRRGGSYKKKTRGRKRHTRRAR